jgi:hypothetical protein
MKVCLLLLAACAATPRAPAVALHEVESPPAGCRPVGRFEGVSAQPGDAGMAQAREQARSKAAAAGATDVVPGNESQSPDAATALVKGYDCGSAPAASPAPAPK